jgi:pimeloyl-ACP methyl ester carboxylesterase
LHRWIANKRHHACSARRDGATIRFYTHGSGSETLLLVNPLVYGLALFQPLLERLCQDFRIVTVDCRGTGGSDPLTRPFPLREHAEDVATVIEALGGGPVIGVGLSRGSNLLIMLAASRPELIGKLVTVGCPLVPGGFGGLATFSDYWRLCPEAHARGDVEALLRILGSFMYSEPGTEELKRQLVERGLRLPKETVLSFYDPDPDVDVSALLGRVAIPALVTHGTADQLIPFSAAEYLAEGLPDARLYGFKGKGHLPIFTATDEFCDVLRTFVHTGTIGFENAPSSRG